MVETLENLIMSRGAQLIARYAGVGLAWLAGKAAVAIPAADGASTSNVVGLLAAAGVCLLVDLIVHKFSASTAAPTTPVK
jgi:hypothetical protein